MFCQWLHLTVENQKTAKNLHFLMNLHSGWWWHMKNNPICVGIKVSFGLVSNQPVLTPCLGRFYAPEGLLSSLPFFYSIQEIEGSDILEVVWVVLACLPSTYAASSWLWVRYTLSPQVSWPLFFEGTPAAVTSGQFCCAWDWWSFPMHTPLWGLIST